MSSQEIVLTRTFEVPAELLYAAWTEPDRMRRWLATEVEADTRLRGGYRLINKEEDGSTNIHVGEYRVLESGRRIVQTFRHTESPILPNIEETLEIRLLPLSPNRTELTLIHTFTGVNLSPEYKESVREGWSAWLDLLEGYLTEAQK